MRTYRYGGYTIRHDGENWIATHDLTGTKLPPCGGVKPTRDHIRHLRLLRDKRHQLFVDTGHELLEPANQYCKHCGCAMFVKENTRRQCKP